MKNTSKSVRNVIVGKNEAKSNLEIDTNAILKIVRDTVKALEVVKIDSLLEAMCSRSTPTQPAPTRKPT